MIPKELVGLVPLVAPVTLPTPEAPKKALRVLVVDDDDMIHAIWRRVRTRLGVDEVITYTSIEACETAGVDYAAFDLCFLDMKIPESKISIMDALRLLKQRGARRVIIATGMPLDAYEQRLREEGADGFAPEKVPLEIKSFLANA